MDDYVVLSIVFALFALSFIWFIYDHTSHSKTTGEKLRSDAQIIDVQTKKIGTSNVWSAGIRTTVTFDDGFIFISHKTERRLEGPFSRKGYLIVDQFVLEEIKKDAISAHQKAYNRQTR